MKTKQKILIQRLYEVLVEVNEEAINDDIFYDWLNENYFFENDLEEIIINLKNANDKILK